MRLFAAILLLLHINYSMFIPQVDEIDVYDRSGRQLEDVNSLSEFIVQSFAPTKHQYSKKDDDDDNARYFQLFRTTLFLQQPFAFVKPQPAACNNLQVPLLNENRLSTGFLRILSPPPKG